LDHGLSALTGRYFACAERIATAIAVLPPDCH
jgi:hypothetical protein